jgi:cytochrome c5
MYRKFLILLPLAGAALIASAVAAKVPTRLTSMAVTLPESTRALPDGPNVATVRNNCLGCHSAGMILNQPAMAKAAWEAEVTKMRNVYKAPVDDKAAPAIVDYLTAVKGPK